jgi:hypothetical protein
VTGIVTKVQPKAECVTKINKQQNNLINVFMAKPFEKFPLFRTAIALNGWLQIRREHLGRKEQGYLRIRVSGCHLQEIVRPLVDEGHLLLST